MITLFAEQVTPGHPDKMADQIADNILDAVLLQDPHARVAVEPFLTGKHVIIGGEMATSAQVDVVEIARDTIKCIGYDSTWWEGFDQVEYHDLVQPQSPDLYANIDRGAGDQGVMYGYAVDTPDYLPVEYSVATRVAQIVYGLHKKNPTEFGADGKTTATVDDKGNLLQVTAALLHSVPLEEARVRVEEEIREHLGMSIPQVSVNTSGDFTVGGPVGDTGLNGRKIIADSYGGRGRHGGGAFSGKDARKVDRTGAYYARSLAIEALNFFDGFEAEVQLGYSIGDHYPRSLNVTVDGYPVEWLPAEGLLTPWMVAEKFDLFTPIHGFNSTFGHFTRKSMPWNR